MKYEPKYSVKKLSLNAESGSAFECVGDIRAVLLTNYPEFRDGDLVFALAAKNSFTPLHDSL